MAQILKQPRCLTVICHQAGPVVNGIQYGSPVAVAYIYFRLLSDGGIINQRKQINAPFPSSKENHFNGRIIYHFIKIIRTFVFRRYVAIGIFVEVFYCFCMKPNVLDSLHNFFVFFNRCNMAW